MTVFSLLPRQQARGCPTGKIISIYNSIKANVMLLRAKDEDTTVGCRKILSGLHVLIISTDKPFTDDWQSVLDSLGAAVTKRTTASARLAQLRAPDVVVTDNKAPPQLCAVRFTSIVLPLFSCIFSI